MEFDELDENGSQGADIGRRILALVSRRPPQAQSLYPMSQVWPAAAPRYLGQSDSTDHAGMPPDLLQSSATPTGRRTVDLVPQQRQVSLFQPAATRKVAPTFFDGYPPSLQSTLGQSSQDIAPGGLGADDAPLYGLGNATAPFGIKPARRDGSTYAPRRTDTSISDDTQSFNSSPYRESNPFTSNVENKGLATAGTSPESPEAATYGGAQAKSSSQQAPRKKSNSYTPPNLASDEDTDAGNFIEVGFRHTGLETGHLFNHAYIGIPVIKDGKWSGEMMYYEVLGNGYGIFPWKNQQVRNSNADPIHNRHTPGKYQYLLKVSPAQLEALGDRLRYFSEHTEKKYAHSCPSCGSRYHALEPAPWNSNTFVYNMLIHNPAGRIEPPEPPHALFGTPGYKVNAPNEDWYPVAP